MTREPLWGVAEVAQYLGLKVGTVYQLVSEKRIPCLRLSARCLRFQPSEVVAWVQRHSHGPTIVTKAIASATARRRDDGAK